MKKLLIFPGNYVPHIGGLETHVDEFVKYASSDFAITLFTPLVRGSKPFEKRFGSVCVIRYPCLKITSDLYIPNLFSIRFWKLLSSLPKPDYTMTRTRFFPNSLLGFLFAKFRRVSNVHVEHGSSHLQSSNRLVNVIAWLYDKTIARLIFRYSFKVVSISQAVHDFVKSEFGLKTPIITRGVDFSAYDGKPDVEILRKYKDKIKIGFAGRLTKWKGIENSLHAFLSLPQSVRANAVFIVVGAGDMSKLPFDPSIVYLGSQPFSRTISLFKSFDVYVHSAYPGGGLSNSLLQALFCKCLVVASPHEGGKEVVNHSTGILLADNSVSSIVRGLRKALAVSDNAKQESAHRFILKHFSWPQKILEYKKLL